MAYPWDTVAIIGVGAIGASIGLGLRQRQLARHVIGATRTSKSAKAAMEIGAVDEMVETMEKAAENAELVVVCTPVQSIAEHVQRCAAAASSEVVLTDGGSTKANLCQALEGLQHGTFVGSHPLAGTHETGPRAGDGDLFRGRTVIMTPVESTPGDTTNRVRGFWQSLEAEVELMTPEQHDQLLASSSHAPHLIASALAASTCEDALRLAASGWKDATRIAQGSVELWQQILRDNRANVLSSLNRFGELLHAMTEALEHDDPALLTQLLERGKQNRDAVGN
jgi:prephenate dehydrogenase